MPRPVVESYVTLVFEELMEGSVSERPLLLSMRMLLRLLPETVKRPTRIKPPLVEDPETKKAKLPLGLGGTLALRTASPVSMGPEPPVAVLSLINRTRFASTM